MGPKSERGDIKRKEEIKRELEELERLEEDQSLSSTQIGRRAQIQHELLSIIEKEEKYWQQRSREKWLLLTSQLLKSMKNLNLHFPKF
jgi:hypothetical protein